MSVLIAFAVCSLLALLVYFDVRRITRKRDSGPLVLSERRKAFAANPHRAGPQPRQPRSESTNGLYDELRARTELRGQHTVVGFIQARKR